MRCTTQTSLIALATACAFATTPALAQELNEAIRQDLPSLMTIYRDLHQHPELSLQETRSAGVMAAEAGKVASYTRPANEFVEPFGSFTATQFALVAQRYLHRFPDARQAMAEVAATIRNTGSRNPDAVMAVLNVVAKDEDDEKGYPDLHTPEWQIFSASELPQPSDDFTLRRDPDGVLVATVQADAFCQSMVRSLVGAMLAAVVAALREMPAVRLLQSVSGMWDLVATAVVPTMGEMDDLTDAIGAIDGVDAMMPFSCAFDAGEFHAMNGGAGTLTITDIHGKVVVKESKNLAKGAQSIPLDIRNLSSGVYLLVFNSEMQRSVKKIVVKD